MRLRVKYCVNLVSVTFNSGYSNTTDTPFADYETMCGHYLNTTVSADAPRLGDEV